MDRDQRWDRVKLAWDTIVHGRGACFESAGEAIQSAYDEGSSDEFVKPSRLPGLITPAGGDEIIFFNFRNDRVRQISAAFALDAFDDFDRGADFSPLRVTCLTHYDDRRSTPERRAPFGGMIYGGTAQSRLKERRKGKNRRSDAEDDPD